LFSRRWVLFAITVALMAYGAVLLGQWQFHRLHNRKADNALVKKNLDDAPVPVDLLMSTTQPAPKDYEWRKVVIHGTWDDAKTIVLKYQTRDSAPGIEVVTPLRTASGTAVLVDRGWMSSENDGDTRPKLPPANTGTVTVIGWVRQDAHGGASSVNSLATRAISSRGASKVLSYPLYQGFVDIQTESPAPIKKLGNIELPDDTSDGPHFFYGLQWWFFGFLAVTGFGYLAYDEWQQRKYGRTPTRQGARPASRSQRPPRVLEEEDESVLADEDRSESPQHATVNGQHDPGDEG
jgi:cytochrome oxidase assembly protein ShyY1